MFPKGERVRASRYVTRVTFSNEARGRLSYIRPWRRTSPAATPAGKHVLENDKNERTLDDMEKGIARLAGKTIAAVVTAANPRSAEQQLFLVFTDGTRLEMRGEHLDFAWAPKRGGLVEAIGAARQVSETIQVFTQECAPPPEYEFVRTKH
nr:hypothetical protein [Gammaproteobacteria bacterium]